MLPRCGETWFLSNNLQLRKPKDKLLDSYQQEIQASSTIARIWTGRVLVNNNISIFRIKKKVRTGTRVAWMDVETRVTVASF